VLRLAQNPAILGPLRPTRTYSGVLSYFRIGAGYSHPNQLPNRADTERAAVIVTVHVRLRPEQAPPQPRNRIPLWLGCAVSETTVPLA
jgi:hypothetical protein